MTARQYECMSDYAEHTADKHATNDGQRPPLAMINGKLMEVIQVEYPLWRRFIFASQVALHYFWFYLSSESWRHIETTDADRVREWEEDQMRWEAERKVYAAAPEMLDALFGIQRLIDHGQITDAYNLAARVSARATGAA